MVLIDQLTTDLTAIRSSLVAKGAEIERGTPLADWPEAINAIEGDGAAPSAPLWQRPADRPVKPAMVDNTILMLFGVSELSPNDMAFAMTCVGGYTVDWGDGAVIDYASAAIAEHNFSFDPLPQSIDAQGYKMVWITVTPTIAEANITVYNTQVRPSQRPPLIFYPQLFELYIQCPQLTSMYWGTASTTAYRQMEIFSLDVNAITGLVAYFLINSVNLRRIEELHLESPAIQLASFMQACTNYNYPFPNYLDFSNVTSNFLYNCAAYNQPFPSNATFPNLTGNYFMYGCAAYNQPFSSGVTFANVTDNFMYGCAAYNQPFPETVTFASINNLFMLGCVVYDQPFPDTVTFAHVLYSFLQGCRTYNQPFPKGVTFATVTSNFLLGNSAYNQPFADGITFPMTASTTNMSFFSGCSGFNHSVTVDLANCIANLDSNFIGGANTSQKGLRLLNMPTIVSYLYIASSALDVDALVLLFGDLVDRTGLGAGSITITNCFGASRLTAEQRAIATNKNWTIVG